MNPFARLFGSSTPAPAAQHSQFLPSSMAMPATLSATRRELLRVVLRDTLNKHGIPSAWLGADVLAATSREREPGLHLRIVLKHWDPRLLECAVAFQKAFLKRAEMFDPLVHTWLQGISWQFALDSDAGCPDLPDPVTWTAAPSPARPAALPVLAPMAAVIAVPAAVPATSIPPSMRTAADRKAALDKLLAENEDYETERRNFEATQPMFAPTEPARF